MSRSIFVVCALIGAALTHSTVVEAAQGYGTTPSYKRQLSGYGDTAPVQWRARPGYIVYDDGSSDVVPIYRRTRVKYTRPIYRTFRQDAPCD